MVWQHRNVSYDVFPRGRQIYTSFFPERSTWDNRRLALSREGKGSVGLGANIREFSRKKKARAKGPLYGADFVFQVYIVYSIFPGKEPIEGEIQGTYGKRRVDSGLIVQPRTVCPLSRRDKRSRREKYLQPDCFN